MKIIKIILLVLISFLDLIAYTNENRNVANDKNNVQIERGEEEIKISNSSLEVMNIMIINSEGLILVSKKIEKHHRLNINYAGYETGKYTVSISQRYGEVLKMASIVKY